MNKGATGTATTFVANAAVADLHADDANLYYTDGIACQAQLCRAPLMANATPTVIAGRCS
jgi:hypothetical protein